jgi:hypothetical protein
MEEGPGELGWLATRGLTGGISQAGPGIDSAKVDVVADASLALRGARPEACKIGDAVSDVEATGAGSGDSLRGNGFDDVGLFGCERKFL